MRQIIFSRMTAGLLAFCLGLSIQMASAQPASGAPFAALRFGYRYTNPDKWPAMRKALEKNAGHAPVELPVVRDGSSVRVRLPRLAAWSCGYLDVR